MALKKAISLPSGIELPNAYHRIAVFNGVSAPEGGELRFTITMCTYKDQAARDAGNNPVLDKVLDEIGVGMSTTGTLQAILYNAVKTLPAYSGAEDV